MWKHECRTCGTTWEAPLVPAAYPPGETAPCGHEYGQVRIAPERSRCWWCEKELWPLMDQRKDEQGNPMHAYCYLQYQKAKQRA